jgi:predicted GNAT family acetyltransferase
MQLHRFDDIKEFCDRTGAYLLEYQAEHNLLLGISHTLLHHPERYPKLPYLAIAFCPLPSAFCYKSSSKRQMSRASAKTLATVEIALRNSCTPHDTFS